MSDQGLNTALALDALALDKVAAVLGRERARSLIDRLLHQLGITLQTPHDLYMLSEAMTKLGGFEGALGAMLGVTAILRGATPARSTSCTAVMR